MGNGGGMKEGGWWQVAEHAARVRGRQVNRRGGGALWWRRHVRHAASAALGCEGCFQPVQTFGGGPLKRSDSFHENRHGGWTVVESITTDRKVKKGNTLAVLARGGGPRQIK